MESREVVAGVEEILIVVLLSLLLLLWCLRHRDRHVALFVRRRWRFQVLIVVLRPEHKSMLTPELADFLIRNIPSFVSQDLGDLSVSQVLFP